MYSGELRAQALQLMHSGRSLSSVSTELGINRSTLREWRDRPIRTGRTVDCWRCTGSGPPDGAAYASLLGYYLGDGCISAGPRAHYLRVSCDRTYPGIIADVAEAIRG